MSLLEFATNLCLTKKEEESISDITSAAYAAWILVNDYFSWDKEWLNYESCGRKGEIASAIWLYMKWYGSDVIESKKLLKAEIMAREQKYCDLKASFIACGQATDSLLNWFDVLDMVTAGNFAWSMTTARYDSGAKDAYPDLRATNQLERPSGFLQDFTASNASQEATTNLSCSEESKLSGSMLSGASLFTDKSMPEDLTVSSLHHVTCNQVQDHSSRILSKVSLASYENVSLLTQALLVMMTNVDQE